jgi:hypothetical protein
MSRRILLLAALYLLTYLIAGFFDLSTTELALHKANAHEGNVFVTNGNVYGNATAWFITLGGAVIMVGCVIFALRNAPRVQDAWLRHPARSFRKFYINPWSDDALAFSPLHMLSFALAFVIFRLLAAGNNLMIAFYGVAPIGLPIEWIAQHSSPLLGFALVVFPIFYILAITISPLSVRILERARRATY